MFERDGPLAAILQRQKESFWVLLVKNPFATLARKLYSIHQSMLSGHVPITFRDELLSIVSVSDTHNSIPDVPDGDLFIHAGDLSQGGTREEIQQSLDWIDRLPHQHKVVIAGNHDMYLDDGHVKNGPGRLPLNWGSITYLQNSSIVLRFKGGRTLNIYGTPNTRKHGAWGFQFIRGTDVFSGTVPLDTDILVSHSPPRFHLDIDGWGDDNLLREIWRIKPKLHVFGHIHGGYGKELLTYDTVQEHYEQICRHHTPWNIWYLLLMVWRVSSTKSGIKPLNIPVTTAVNPATVGGIRDNVRRKPIVVYL